MTMHFEPKDARRIADIVTKSKGNAFKALDLSRTMANRITHADKALRRARAAEAVNLHPLAAIFFVRYGQLTATEAN